MLQQEIDIHLRLFYHADADYQEFARLLEAGEEMLPSASAQLEEKEKAATTLAAVSGGHGGRTLIVTPLMEFLRQRHAANPGLKLGIGGRAGRGGARTGRKEQEQQEQVKVNS